MKRKIKEKELHYKYKNFLLKREKCVVANGAKAFELAGSSFSMRKMWPRNLSCRKMTVDSKGLEPGEIVNSVI